MTIIKVKLDQAEALRRGFSAQEDSRGHIAIDVQPTASEESRKLIADYLYKTGDEYTVAIPHIYPTVREPTVEGLVEAVQAYSEKVAAETAEKERKRAKALEQLRETIAARRTKTVTEGRAVPGHSGWHPTPYVFPDVHVAYSDARDELSDAERADLEAWEAELQAQNAATLETWKQRLDAQKAEKEAAEAAKAKEVSDWIAAHGSSRLRKLEAAKIERMAVYRDERLALERPDWEWEPEKMYLSEPRNAPEEALDFLAEVSAAVPSVLKYYQFYRPAEYDEEGDKDGEVIGERGYVCNAQFMGESIVTKKRIEM